MTYQNNSCLARQREVDIDEKIFAKLIIQSSTVHTGGDLVVYDSKGESQKVIDFGKKDGKSVFSVYYAAYWVDSEYEILPIESGFCLSFVYSLCWTKSKIYFLFIFILF